MSAGYTHVVHLDAQKFKDRFEKEHGEKLDWNPSRLERLKDLPSVDDHPKIFTRAYDGKVDVLDGRHRIATAANSGRTIRVVTPGKKADGRIHKDVLVKKST